MKSLDIYKKIRKNWGNISPVTKVKKSNKLYKRAKNKREIDKLIREE